MDQGGEAYVLWMGLEPRLGRRLVRRLLGRRLEPRLRRLARRLGLVKTRLTRLIA